MDAGQHIEQPDSDDDAANIPQPEADYFDLLTVAQVIEIAGISQPTIYRRMAAGTFPKAVTLGPKCNRWYRGEIRDWARSLPRYDETA